MFVCNMFVICNSGDPERVQRRRPPTAGAQFKASVNALMKNLLSKSPNYIRCVKVSTLVQVYNEPFSLNVIYPLEVIPQCMEEIIQIILATLWLSSRLT